MATKDEKIIVDLSQGTFVDTVFKNGALQLTEIGVDSLGQKVYTDQGHWISSVITYPDKFKEYENMEFTPVIQGAASYKISVSSSDDMATWSEYVEIDSQNNILNEKSNYVRIKIELFASKVHSEMVVDNFTTNGYNNDQIVVADGKLKLNKNQTLNGAIDSSAVPTVLNTTISKTNLKKINGVGYEGSPQSAIKTLILSSGEYRKWVEGTPPPSENVIPTMTSNTSPSGEVSSSSIFSASYDAWKAFDRQDGQSVWATPNGTNNGWIKYKFAQAKPVDKYSIKQASSWEVGTAPKNWTFEGSNNNVDWTVLDTQSNISNWTLGEIKTFSFKNAESYLYYRLNISSGNANASNYIVIQEIEMFEIIPTFTSTWITVSTTLPTAEQFLEHGMDGLSVLDRKLTALNLPTTMTQTLGSGKVYKATIDLNKIIDLKSISLE